MLTYPCCKLVDMLGSLLSIYPSMYLPYGSIAARTQSEGGVRARGFGSMDPVRRREVASRGGKASGGNFANNTARAVLAGRKGGEHRPVHAK
jgi:general stress protein YciG